MITRKLSSLLLGVAASLAWTGCQPAANAPVARQQTAPNAQVERRPEAAPFDAEDDLSRVHLLNLKTVQTDLGLTANQIDQLEEMVKAYRERARRYLSEARKILPPSRSLSREESAAGERRHALLVDFISDSRDLQVKILAMLTPSQSKRLKQIHLQAAIPAALVWPAIVEALGISEEQCAKISSVRDRVWEKANTTEWPDLRGLGAQERLKRVVEYYRALDRVKAEATQHMLDALTSEQRTTLEKLQGKKIDVTQHYDTLTPEDIEVWDFLQGGGAGLTNGVGSDNEARR